MGYTYISLLHLRGQKQFSASQVYVFFVRLQVLRHGEGFPSVLFPPERCRGRFKFDKTTYSLLDIRFAKLT